MTPQIKARKPTGLAPWPFLLIEGEEFSGKTTAAGLLTKSERIGDCYWLDLGEGEGDRMGGIPGAHFQVIEHDGSYTEIKEQIAAVQEEAKRARAAGEKPVTLIIDAFHEVWAGCSMWADARHRARLASKRNPVLIPDGEPTKIAQDIWNDAAARYRAVIKLLLLFPGIVVVTSRGKEVTAMGKDGRPVEGTKEWKVEGHRTIGYDASMWIRMTRSVPPIVIGCRDFRYGVIPGVDDPQPIRDHRNDLLEHVIFDLLHLDPDNAQVRDARPTQVRDGEIPELAAQAQREQAPPQRRGARPAKDERGQWQPPGPTDAQAATARALAYQTARAATAAATLDDIDEIAAGVAKPLLQLDVGPVITPAQRTAAAVYDSRLQAAPRVPLYGWLETCRLVIEKGGSSVADASAYDEPDDAPTALATVTA